MKKTICLLVALLTAFAFGSSAQEVAVLHIALLDGNALTIPYADINSTTFEDGCMTITTQQGTLSIPVSSISSFGGKRMADALGVSVHYDETAGVTYANGLAHRGVTVVTDGAHVIVNNPVDDTETTITLSGSHSNGSLTYNGVYKCTLVLDSLHLSSQEGAAINVQCGKRTAVKVNGDNVLSDAAAGTQKACLYFKGHAELAGSGTLTLTGNTKHALAAKEYLQLKKSFGSLHVISAVGDGIHAGQYFQMNGGVVTIEGTGDDGIQAEATDDNTDEDNGQLLIKGGDLRITLTAQDVAGLKSDSLLTISGGNVTISASGAADKCIKSGTDMMVTGGCIVLNNSGNGATIDGEDETAKGLSADGNMMLVGGDISITMSGTGGKGIKVDGAYQQGDPATGEGPVLNVQTTGASFSGSGSNTSPWGFAPPGGGGRFPPGGGGGFPGGGESSGSSAKAIKVMGAANIYGGETTVSTATSGAEGLESKTSVNIAGGHHYFKCYDDCINSSGAITFDGGITVCYSNGNDAVDSNYGRTGAITIGNGVILAYSTKGSPEEGLDCDNNSYIRVTGNGYAISAGGAQGGGSSSSTITGASQGYAFVTSSISYATGRYYTLADASGNNLITYSLDASLQSSLSFFTAKGMVKGNTYTLKYSTKAPTDSVEQWHGIFVGSTATGTTSVTTITAK